MTLSQASVDFFKAEAEVYGVVTKRLNEQMKHNTSRFPEDFVFQLTSEEKAEVVANCDHLIRNSNFQKHCRTGAEFPLRSRSLYNARPDYS